MSHEKYEVAATFYYAMQIFCTFLSYDCALMQKHDKKMQLKCCIAFQINFYL